MIKTLLSLLGFFFCLQGLFSQSKSETLDYAYNLMKDAKEIKISSGTGENDLAKHDGDGGVKLGPAKSDKIKFNIMEITGIGQSDNSVKITVECKGSIGLYKQKNSKYEYLYLIYDSEEIAIEKNKKLEKALTHLAKQFKGEFTYDIFGD